MENPNWSMIELEGPSEDDFIIPNTRTDPRAKSRGRNARQLTWVLLLKAHRATGCLTSIASTLASFGPAIRRRVVSGRTDTDKTSSLENKAVKTGFYNCIKLFLWLSLLLLGFEIAAYCKGWHYFVASKLQLEYIFTPSFGVRDIFDWLYTNWVLIRVGFIAPPVQFLANVCIVLFLIQSLVCELDWPKTKIWQQEGANIVYRHRAIRDGYKAGNLKSAMSCSYVKDYEFVAIFDADVQPTHNYLKLTVPHFKEREGNEEGEEE